MRLTLRTLLAWMDDTLQPNQVKEIGRQVGESPVARELSERISRVTRQRRLTVPGSSGPDAADPNVVAAYLDNDLDPDGVAEFETLCLKSDVNLAEVASVHQILSLLGHKVKVPDEARKRMYHLVRGREASASRRAPAAKPAVKEPVTRPIQPWVMPELPKRPWIERYGPAAACGVLILLSIWAARESLKVPPQGPSGPILTDSGPLVPSKAPAPAPEPAREAPEVAAAGGEAAPMPGADAEGGPAPEPAPAEATKAAKAAEPAKSGPAPPPEVPAGVAALAEKPDGILLLYNEDRREWVRIDKETRLRTNDRILCLEPFRAAIDVGKLRIVLVRQTEVRILSQPSDPVPAIELIQGQVAIRQPGTPALKVQFAKQAVTVEMASDSHFGMERISFVQPGQPVTQPASLGVLCQQGEVTLVDGGKRTALKPLSVALVNARGDVQTGQRPSLPEWLTRSEPTASEGQVRDQFIKLFHADRPVLAEVVAAIEDEQPEIKPLAISALAALGDLSLLMPTLSRPGDPVARRAAISAVRNYMMQGPEDSARVRAALDEEFGRDLGGLAHRMLVAITPDEAARGDLATRLVGLLSPDQESIGLRELALDNLKRITGRDDLGYDPDKPAGKGFDAWNDLLRRNELRPPSPPAGRAVRTKGQR